MFSEKCAKQYHIKKGDQVEVLSGIWRKESGKVVAVVKKKDRVVLEMQGLSPEKQEMIGKRTVKKSPKTPQRGLVERAVSVHVSNVRKKA
jgi:large subunit ribosomal protein L24